MTIRTLLWTLIVATPCGCTTEIVTWEQPLQDEDGAPIPDGDEYQVGEEVFGIPGKKLPDPGDCIVWYPDRGAGKQPDPDDCDDLRESVPDEAWLLYRPNAERRVFRIG